MAIGQAILEKKGTDLIILKVDNLTAVADYFIFCSGNSDRHVKAIAEAIDGEMGRRFSSHPMIEGANTATWILLDFGDIVVHVFREDIRAYYGIENMWRDAEHIPVSECESFSPVSVPSHRPHPVKVAHH